MHQMKVRSGQAIPNTTCYAEVVVAAKTGDDKRKKTWKAGIIDVLARDRDWI